MCPLPRSCAAHLHPLRGIEMGGLSFSIISRAYTNQHTPLTQANALS